MPKPKLEADRKPANSPVSNEGTEAKASENEAGTSKPEARVPDSVKECWHPEEREHHRIERFYWKITGCLTFAAVAGAAATVLISVSTYKEAVKATFEAHRQADIARDAYVGSNRGWLHVSVDPKGLAITWEDNGGVVVTGQMITNNEGNSPALGVLTNYKAFIEGKESTFSRYMFDRQA